MLYKDCIEELTGLEDFIVTDVKNVFGKGFESISEIR